MEISQIAIKMDKVKRLLVKMEKAGDQAKSWAAIGRERGVDILNHFRDLKQELELMAKTYHSYGIPLSVLTTTDIARLRTIMEKEENRGVKNLLKEIMKMWER